MTELLGIQEMTRRFEKAESSKDILASIKETMERNAYFDFQDANPYGTGITQVESGLTPMARDDAFALANSIKNIPLREFLAKSGTTGIAGAAYLIPTKIYGTLAEPAAKADVVNDISMAVLPPEQLPGTQTKVDILVDGSYVVWGTSSGATAPTETLRTTQATLDFSTTYTINFRIAQDLIEDSQWDLVETHIRMAGKKCGEKASDLALTVLATATDGDGTINGTVSGDANETRWRGATTFDCEDAILANLDDNWDSDTMVVTKNAMLHNIMATSGAQYSESTVQNDWVKSGWPTQLGGLNLVYSNVDCLTNSGVMDNLVTLIFAKQYALLSGRKRWLRIENYAEPIKDLVGATVSFRQDSVTVYNDAVAKITET